MATGLEILGGVAAAVQLTQLMANFIKNFGTLQNTPRQVKRLERVLDDLNDAHLIQEATPKERKRLWDLVLVAERTLQRSMNDPPSRLLQFFWPEESEKRLKDQNDELQSELITLGLRVDRRRWATYLRYLQSGAGVNVVGPLEVKYLRVLERDEETRLIHYERRTEHHHVSVTHRIPRGCLRFEDDSLSDNEVHFLGAHPITVIRSGTGHEVYFLHAKYKFSSLEQREQFLAHMLERTLLGRFYAEEIRYNGQLHAQGKVIRLWKKKEETRSGQARDAVKLTFLAREERQFEWDLSRVSRHVLLGEGGWVTIRECDADEMIKEDAAVVAIKFRQPESELGKRQRRRSSAAIITHEITAPARDTEQGPEAKKTRRSSTWRRLSRSAGTAKDKKSGSSSECLPQHTLSKSTGKLLDVEVLGSDDAVSVGTSTTDVKSDAEMFRDVFLQHHPAEASRHFTPLPLISPTPEWDPGDFIGSGMGLGIRRGSEMM
ncbi:hypothetical protein B0T16DRAFT_460684 [Cercophora newfieldiana]|uniref:Uncharacterized protein n=1 Tax=Cercophora newfieldiana TaxID=92897 RepID=A0AA39Y3C9_9PEZI|nr:hypothetical protein B0T16DRAFT_460684 [Cercophora newfieldiana]